MAEGGSQRYVNPAPAAVSRTWCVSDEPETPVVVVSDRGRQGRATQKSSR